VPQLLKKANAWSDYCDSERPPLEAIAKLGRQRRALRTAA
jgi:bifunctional non-homologous end joining protein LigD